MRNKTQAAAKINTTLTNNSGNNKTTIIAAVQAVYATVSPPVILQQAKALGIKIAPVTKRITGVRHG
jgi:hypothetical protein